MIRKKARGEAFAVTTPLIKKADGTKFGKTAGGNIWLDKTKTSPYKFYQYWINASDEDALTYIKIFTLKTKEEIEELAKEHGEAPHLRKLQKALAEEVTVRVHSKDDLNAALEASEILFKKGDDAIEGLKQLDESTFMDVFEGVPNAEISKEKLAGGIAIVDLLVAETGFLKSNSEARRALKENSISINKVKINDSFVANSESTLNNKYMLLQRGKKNYFVIKIS